MTEKLKVFTARISRDRPKPKLSPEELDYIEKLKKQASDRQEEFFMKLLEKEIK